MPTTAQRKELERAAKHPLGLVEFRGAVGGLARSSWERKMHRLCEAGLFTRYVHGGYEITSAGRAELAGSKADREPNMDGRQPFIPGFETEEQAREAGRKFYEKTNGKPGIEGVDFHLSKNKHERWHFEEGRAPKKDR